MSTTPTPEAAVDPALLVEPLDIQHDTDPADDHGPARRIPHLGHAVLFFSLTVFLLLLTARFAFTILSSIWHVSPESAARDFPTTDVAVEAFAYILVLAVSAWLFPRLWEKSFLQGIQWNFLAVQRRWRWLLPGGVLLSALAQVVEVRFIHAPDHPAIEKVLTTQHGAYMTAAFAVLFAPLMEEIAFRGFLLPALATAYDWLALERTPAGLQRWESSTAHTTSALIFAALIASIPFALMHAPQLSFAWGAISVLYAVSLALSFVRIRLHSVAASTLLHATYNLTIFVGIFIGTGGFRHLEQFSK
jgi:membrane protease YdiL (CAAX protease family)